MTLVLYLLVGLVAGTFSGLVGIGGGVIIVPILAMLFGFSQHQAQGTTLALMVPPIGLMAAWTYYKQGYVDLRIAGLIALGFLLGGWLGAKFAVQMPDLLLKRIFGGTMIAIGVKMLFLK